MPDRDGAARDEAVARPRSDRADSGAKAALRILLLAPHPFFEHRGTPLAVRALLEVLAERGYHIDVLTYEQGERVQIPNCTIHRIRAPFRVRNIRPGFSAKKLACDAVMLRHCLQLVRSRRYDLIHAVEESSFMAIAAKKIKGIPFIYDMDSSLAQQMIETHPVLRPVKGLLVAAERWAVRESFGVLAVCRTIEDTVRGYEPGKMVARVEDVSLLSPNPTHGELLSRTIGTTGPLVMYVGNLERYQGIDLLLASFQHTLQSVPDAQLVIIGGSDADVRRYRLRSGKLGIGGNVHLIGPRPVSLLGWYLQQADVLVSPRIRGYNTPMKIYSYLDSGRPVLATRLLTHTQVLDDAISLLAEPTPATMGEALTRLLRDPALRQRLAVQARKRLREEYSQGAFRRKVHDFYDSIEQALLEYRRSRRNGTRVV